MSLKVERSDHSFDCILLLLLYIIICFIFKLSDGYCVKKLKAKLLQSGHCCSVLPSSSSSCEHVCIGVVAATPTGQSVTYI